MLNVFNTNYEIIEEVARDEFKWRLSRKDPWGPNAEWDIVWSDVAPGLSYWKEMKPYQKINHFPGMF